MKKLSDHTEIITTKANTGGAVAIMDVKDYINEAHCQLNNKGHCKILNKDPTAANAKLLNDTIKRFKKEKLLKEKIADGLKVSNPKTPKFYMQPKLLKKITLVNHVKSLYTNIPNNEGIKAAREAYDKHSSKSVSTKVKITFLSLIPTLYKTLYSTALTIYNLWDVQWAQFVFQHSLIFLWHNLKQNIYACTFMSKFYYFHDTRTIFS